MILNEKHQIVFANRAAASLLNVLKHSDLYGMRPGEALGCVHANESEHGCGTTMFCRTCGAVKSILTAFQGTRSVEECHVKANHRHLSYDFRVTTSPYFFDDEHFVMLVLNDISNEKRREVLERTFFHDVNNTLQVLLSTAEIMPPHATTHENELAQVINTGIRMLANEVKSQQSLLLAEDGGLALELQQLGSKKTLSEIISLYSHYDCAQKKKIEIDDQTVDAVFISDKIQFSRVIGNMLKNAMEASSHPNIVTVGCKKPSDGQILFWVHNEQHMAQKIKDQVFNRSFSTKGTGRGVGTYSIKLLGEVYLGGKVSFTSTPEAGTTFFIELPVAGPPRA
ncbi:MAG: PAS domain-containing sensor histidine kinase [Kiritimatiellae bacterium]|nr:PAS domain-containing sensor histidine kinase [Kiritimatiellia bacterium]